MPMARPHFSLITLAATWAVLLGLGATTTAEAQSKRARTAPPPPVAADNASATPRALAKIYRRPLMRVARLQYCLAGLGRFDGRASGRLTPATVKALATFRTANQLRTDVDVEKDWALHAVLWRECRPLWSKAGGQLDTAGLPVKSVATIADVGPSAKAASDPPATVASVLAAVVAPAAAAPTLDFDLGGATAGSGKDPDITFDAAPKASAAMPLAVSRRPHSCQQTLDNGPRHCRESRHLLFARPIRKWESGRCRKITSSRILHLRNLAARN